MTLFGALLLLAVSYSRDIAPIFAMHCNSCHGDGDTAGGLELRTYTALMKSGAIVPGDPDGSQVVQFIEGRRGEEHRMPLGGPPLSAVHIGQIRAWIAEGAPDDSDDTPRKKQVIAKVRLRANDPLRVVCRIPAAAYLIMDVVAQGKVLFERRAAVKPPNESVSWMLWPEKGWPATVDVEVTFLYTEAPAKGCATL